MENKVLFSIIINVLGHIKLILWMTDFQQKKIEQASEFFFFLIIPKNEASEEATIKKKNLPQKWGERRSIFFSKKKT